VIEPLAATPPRLGVIVTLVASVVAHDKVADIPRFTVVGFALNNGIVGGLGGRTITLADCVDALPQAFETVAKKLDVAKSGVVVSVDIDPT